MADAVETSEQYWGTRVKEAFAGSAAESFIGIGSIALAVIGLSGVFPELLAAVSSIAVGLSLAFEGGSLSARYSALISLDEKQPETEVPLRWGGITSLFFAGATGIALGVLSLIGVAPMTLIPVAAIVFGAALLLDSGANTRLSVLEARYSERFQSSERLVRETAQASAGVQVLVGIGSTIMGILAVTGISPLVLSLVTMLSIGAAGLLTGTMIGGRTHRSFSSEGKT